METFRIFPETVTMYVCINFFIKVDQLIILQYHKHRLQLKLNPLTGHQTNLCRRYHTPKQKKNKNYLAMGIPLICMPVLHFYQLSQEARKIQRNINYLNNQTFDSLRSRHVEVVGARKTRNILVLTCMYINFINFTAAWESFLPGPMLPVLSPQSLNKNMN